MNRLSGKCRRARAVPPMLETIESRTLLSAALAAVMPAALPPIVAVVASKPVASEITGASGRFTFVRTGPHADPLTVHYTVSGTATAGADYTALSGTITFEAGKTRAKIDVAPLTDAIAEGNENVVVTLDASADYRTSHRDSAKVTIRDAAPTVTVSRIGSAFEAGTINPVSASFVVTRTGPLIDPLMFTYAISGTAQSGIDFIPLPGSAIIPAGRRSTVIKLTPIADNVSEPRENVILTLNPSTSFNLSTNIHKQSATINISDTRAAPIIPSTPIAFPGFDNFITPSVIPPSTFGVSPALGADLGTGSLIASPSLGGVAPMALAIGPFSSDISDFNTIAPPGITPLPTILFSPVTVAPAMISTTPIVVASTVNTNFGGTTAFAE